MFFLTNLGGFFENQFWKWQFSMAYEQFKKRIPWFFGDIQGELCCLDDVLAMCPQIIGV